MCICISCEHPQCGFCSEQSCHAGISEAQAIFRQHGIHLQRTGALFHPGSQARVYRGILHLIFGRVSDLRRKAHHKCVYPCLDESLKCSVMHAAVWPDRPDLGFCFFLQIWWCILWWARSRGGVLFGAHLCSSLAAFRPHQVHMA